MSIEKFEHRFWNILNFLARRVVGVVWLLGGLFATLSSLTVLFDPSASINVEGFSSNSLGIKLLGVLISLTVAVCGWMFMRAPKYYPPKIKQWMKENNLTT